MRRNVTIPGFEARQQSRFQSTHVGHTQTGTALLFAGALICTAATLLLSLASPDLRIVAYGGLCCIIITIPALKQTFRWVSPWTMVMLATYFGCGLRSIAVWNRGLTDASIDRLYLRGHALQLVDKYVWLFLAGLTVLSISYAVASSRSTSVITNPVRLSYQFGQRAWVVVALLAVVGAIGFYLYVDATGGFDSGLLSAKRSIYMRGSSYQGSHGLLRTVNSLSAVAFYLGVALFAMRRPTALGDKLARSAALSLLLLNAAALDFYSSTRAQIAYTMIGAAVLYAMIRGSLPRKSLVIAGTVGAGLMAWLTILRQASQGERIAVSPSTMTQALSDGLVLNRNFTEIFKTVNIIDAVPRLLEYSHGSTIANYLVAFVPRSLWADKPIIDPGVIVGVRVYGTDGTSIPPGLVAESYWAFGLVGVFVGAIVVGLGLAWIERKYIYPLVSDTGRAVIYSYVWFPIGGVALGGAIGNSLMVAVISLVLVLTALRACGKWTPV